MFAAHWGLAASPFGGTTNPADYYASPTHEEALARLLYLIENGRRMGFLLGDSGTGKSLLLTVAARQLRDMGCQTLRLNLTGLAPDELTWKLADGLRCSTTPEAGPVRWWRGIADRLTANRYQRISTAILLDDAHTEQGVETTIRRLALSDPHPDSRLTIVLASQRPIAAQFGSKLNDLCELRIEVDPWDAEETAEYIQDALVRSGGHREVFHPAALERIHELTGGVPRQVRQLAEICLAAGAAERVEQIEARLDRYGSPWLGEQRRGGDRLNTGPCKIPADRAALVRPGVRTCRR